jgi:hypothetical protein
MYRDTAVIGSGRGEHLSGPWLRISMKRLVLKFDSMAMLLLASRVTYTDKGTKAGFAAMPESMAFRCGA